MGSDSDLPVMQEAANILEQFAIAHEVAVVSAHRTPERLREYGKEAEARGIRVIIAGAGGAAHLPGMIAAFTTIPVIGVPIKTKSLNGIDSLLSVVQMPPGVPVASVAINGAKNAGLLAAQIIGSSDSEVRAKIAEYKEKMATDVSVKDAELQEKGYQNYLEDHGLIK